MIWQILYHNYRETSIKINFCVYHDSAKLEFTIFSCIKFFSFSDNYCVTCLRFDRRQTRKQLVNAAKAAHALQKIQTVFWMSESKCVTIQYQQ